MTSYTINLSNGKTFVSCDIIANTATEALLKAKEKYKGFTILTIWRTF